MTMPVDKRRKDPRSINLISHTTTRHPLGIKPEGNIYLQENAKSIFQIRSQSLGKLSILPDEVITTILNYLSINDLKVLMTTSKFLYAFLADEEFWKKYYMKFFNSDQDIEWKGSWKNTLLNWENEVTISSIDLMSDYLYRPFQIAHLNYQNIFDGLVQDEWNLKINGINSDGRIARYSHVNDDQFKQLVNTPFIITECEWPKWDLQILRQKYGHVKFRQESVNWSLNSFIDYLTTNNDEIPLYLFDCNSEAIENLRAEYNDIIPKIFKTDYFNYFDTFRPDHSWLIIGNKNSGSSFHKDPNNTSAWNACITGKKLWIMLPPHIVPPGVTTNHDQSEVTSPVSIGEWILSGFYNDILKIPETQMGITFPGECMYVPSNWWHLVINLDTCIAITENFVPKHNLTPVLEFFKYKPSQISGFKLNDINQLIEKLSYKSPEILEFMLKQKQAQYSEQELYDDCGEVKNLPTIPMFEIFKQLLIENDKQVEIEEALQKLSPQKTKGSKTNKSIWTTLKATNPNISSSNGSTNESTSTNDTSGFSFNFAVD